MHHRRPFLSRAAREGREGRHSRRRRPSDRLTTTSPPDPPSRIKGSRLPRRPRNGSARLFLRSGLGAGAPAAAVATATTSSMVSSLGAQRRDLPYPTSSSYSLARHASPRSTGAAGSRRAPSPSAPPPPTRKSSENLICSVPAAMRWSSNGWPGPALAPTPLPGEEAVVYSRSSSEEARETKERTERKRCAGRRK